MRRKKGIQQGYAALDGEVTQLHKFFTIRSRLGNPARACKDHLVPVAVHQDNASALDDQGAGTLYAGELEIRLGEGLVLATGHALRMSVREFELLAALAQRAGAIVTREELYGAVWGSKLRNGDRSVDVYVSKLRGKLEETMPDRRFIHTHPGFGYRFQPQLFGTPSELSRDVHNGRTAQRRD